MERKGPQDSTERAPNRNGENAKLFAKIVQKKQSPNSFKIKPN